jgi:NAD(P)H-dependent flavin oxidoreductase YrpB (nitropropane dioxygenase family)
MFGYIGAMETTFTRLVGCSVPIQQAGMGGTATPELAAAVAEAGALGMIGMPMAGTDAVIGALERLAKQTSGVFGINFLMPFIDREAVEAASSRARVVEFFYGDPDASLVALAHAGGALVSWQVGSVAEARAAADAGCDFVIAQGVEAGGHVRGELGLLVVLDQVLDALDIPVLAAGGIGTARGVAAVLAAGAAGARVGTRFVAAEEADAHPSYVDALIAAGPDDTVLTTTFSVMWPDAPHRVLRSCIGAVMDLSDEVVAEGAMPDGSRMPIPRLAPASPGRQMTGHIRAMAHYAGESVGGVRGRQGAADIVRELAGGAEEFLACWR